MCDVMYCSVKKEGGLRTANCPLDSTLGLLQLARAGSRFRNETMLIVGIHSGHIKRQCVRRLRGRRDTEPHPIGETVA